MADRSSGNATCGSAETSGQRSNRRGRGGAHSNGNFRRNNNHGGDHSNGNVEGRKGSAPNHNHKVDMRKYEKMIGAAHDNFSDIHVGTGKIEECTICCKTGDIFGIGICRHPVCIECAIRLRILANNPACPVCRTEIKHLFIMFASDDMQSITLEFPLSKHPDEKRFGVRFQNKDVGIRYEKYLAHVCKICKSSDGERLEFPTFNSLRQHMANVHELSYCHICTENLNLFSRERKSYNRDGLQRHIRSGDPDDKSLKGHPKCLFCDQRFFDEEARYRHLRKEHFFCQFCEASGTTNTFFDKHAELVAHYREKHFLCEAEECKAMGIAFNDQIGLKLHRAKEHSDSKRLGLDFQFNDRQLGSNSTSRSGGQRNIRERDREPLAQHRGERIVMVQQEAPPPRPASDFVVIPSAQSTNRAVTYNLGPAYTPQQQDFPSLGGINGPTVRLPPADFPRLNRVNKPGQPSSTTAQQKKKSPVEDFPSLGGRPNKSAPQGNDDWARHSARFDMIDDDEHTARPPTVVETVRLVPASSLVRPNPPAVLRKAPPPATTRGEEFPALPAATPRNPTKPAWGDGKKKANAIVGCSVPSTYSKKKELPTPELWPTTGSESCEPVEEEWSEIPSTKPVKKTKQEKKKNEATGAAPMASVQTTPLPQTSQPKSLKDIGDMLANKKNDNHKVVKKAEEWQTAGGTKTNFKEEKQKSKKNNGEKKTAMKEKVEKKEYEVVDNKKEEQPSMTEKEHDDLILRIERACAEREETERRLAKIEEKRRKDEEEMKMKKREEERIEEARREEEEKQRLEQIKAERRRAVEETIKEDNKQTVEQPKSMFANFFSIPSMFSGISNAFGASSPTVENVCLNDTAPPGFSSVPPTSSANLLFGPPPGFEDVLSSSSNSAPSISSAPPPGLSFDNVPFLSDEDCIRKAPVKKEQSADDGWTKAGKK